jgi:hypothetical protein
LVGGLLAVGPGGVLVVGGVVAEAAMQDADEAVAEGAEGLVVEVAGGAVLGLCRNKRCFARVATSGLRVGATVDSHGTVSEAASGRRLSADLAPVSLIGGRTGWAYVCHGEADALAEPWSYEAFAEHDLVGYVDDCHQWRKAREMRQSTHRGVHLDRTAMSSDRGPRGDDRH